MGVYGKAFVFLNNGAHAVAGGNLCNMFSTNQNLAIFQWCCI